jgi:prefoldin subunit 5
MGDVEQTTLQVILQKLETLQQSVDKLEKQLQYVETVVPSCQRMDDHVSFVNGVYTTMKSPIEYVCSAFTRTKTTLPNIADNYLEDRS